MEFNATSLMVIASEGENGITASNISSDFEASVNSPNVNCIEENSYFKDAVLEEEVRKFITKKTNQEYNCESVGRLTYLELPASNISSLSGIEKLDRLTTLVVSDNSITDLSPLNSLPSLRVLNASRNKISILKPINSLQTIEFLELTGNYIETIENLEAGIWGNLVKLDISDNCLDPKGTQVQLLNSSLDENVIILGEQKADCS